MRQASPSKPLLNLSISPEHQAEMCRAYYDGAPGIFVSGMVWVAAAVVCALFGITQGVWTLLIGGAAIYPASLVVTKALGRPAKTVGANALNQLGMASTIWLIVGYAMAYGLFCLNSALFFPAMIATIGSRYLIFASMYGKTIYWAMGGSLIVAGIIALFANFAPLVLAGIGGIVEILFASIVFLGASKYAV